MWFASHVAVIYITLGLLAIDDIPTGAARRDVDNFFSPQDCVEFMRFTRDQIVLMLELLMVPAIIRTECGFVVGGREALCVLLYRLAFPYRLKDMRLVFRPERILYLRDFQLDATLHGFQVGVPPLAGRSTAGTKASYFCGGSLQQRLSPDTLLGLHRRNCARPIRNQRFFYNGYKRKHAIKFQGVVTPDGLFVELYGAVVGTRHDGHLLAQSALLEKLQTHMNSPSGHRYCLYGNPAYGQTDHIQCPFSVSVNGPLTPAMRNFNKSMSRCRVTVEWGFKEMTSKWAFIDMKCQHKFLLSPVATQYKVATLLSNFHSCLNGGNQISQYFGVEPPTLEEYLKL
ncbi:unnamed protein product [Ectocarpus sp. CCAP 1310/34]|nr:unnamed protein product [Ectocarpus sp. CCAP 1310/34]